MVETAGIIFMITFISIMTCSFSFRLSALEKQVNAEESRIKAEMQVDEIVSDFIFRLEDYSFDWNLSYMCGDYNVECESLSSKIDVNQTEKKVLYAFNPDFADEVNAAHKKKILITSSDYFEAEENKMIYDEFFYSGCKLSAATCPKEIKKIVLDEMNIREPLYSGILSCSSLKGNTDLRLLLGTEYEELKEIITFYPALDINSISERVFDAFSECYGFESWKWVLESRKTKKILDNQLSGNIKKYFGSESLYLIVHVIKGSDRASRLLVYDAGESDFYNKRIYKKYRRI